MIHNFVDISEEEEIIMKYSLVSSFIIGGILLLGFQYYKNQQIQQLQQMVKNVLK